MTTSPEQIKANLEELEALLAQLDQVITQRQHARDRREIQRRRTAVAWALNVARVVHMGDQGRHLKVVVNDSGDSQDVTS